MKRFGMSIALAAAMLATGTPLWAGGESTAQQAFEIVIPPPPAGQGQLVFFRRGGFVGSAAACSVKENGQKVSSLGAGHFFVMVAPPGKHQFSVKTEVRDSITLEVEPDETQFVECKIKMGVVVGHPDIRPAQESDFRSAGRLKLPEAEDMGPAPGALRPAEFLAAQQAARAGGTK